MKVAFVAAEMVPFAKTGGLADVTGSLTGEIQALGQEVAVFLPRYKCVNLDQWNCEKVISRLTIHIGNSKETAQVFSHKLDSGVRVYLIDQPGFYDREGIYGTLQGDYPDNDRRFIFFQRAVLESLKRLKFKADIIHCHDWHTGLIPVYLKSLYKEEAFFQKVKTVFTIHNLGYQGNFPPDSVPLTGMGWEQFRVDRLEFYGKLSFLKGALLDSDAITTVSERYNEEIQTKEFGCGMEGVISKRKNALYGIVNGIDLNEWNPETDANIKQTFSAATIEQKLENKKALQKENELEVDFKRPVVGLVSRLVDQKGLDILIPAMKPLIERGFQFVILGTGDEKYHGVLREFAKKNRGKCGVHILFDLDMAKRIYAGADMMLLPSYYEPCGLGQMIAMRFGTIPVVRATGGLADTVQEYSPKTQTGNGFSFEEYTSEAFMSCLGRAIKIFQQPEEWQKLIQNAMACDFSWNASAKKYVQVYEVTKGSAKGVK